jgi:hypothetical protein
VPLLSRCYCAHTLQNLVNAAINLLYELVHDPRLAGCKSDRGIESALELAELKNYQYRSIHDYLYDRVTKSLYRQQNENMRHSQVAAIRRQCLTRCCLCSSCRIDASLHHCCHCNVMLLCTNMYARTHARVSTYLATFEHFDSHC